MPRKSNVAAVMETEKGFAFGGFRFEIGALEDGRKRLFVSMEPGPHKGPVSLDPIQVAAFRKWLAERQNELDS